MLRWPALLLVAFALLVPMLLVTTPPLVDVPGHLAQFAIETAAPTSPLRHYFDFHWALVLNLGADLLILPLKPLVGLERGMWLIAAAIPLITGIGVMLSARMFNPRGCAAIGWALLFVYSYPYSYGFLNYTLAAGLSLVGFALWPTLDRRPWSRAAIFALAGPPLMIAHAIGGLLLPALIGSYELGRLIGGGVRSPVKIVASLAARLWPFVTIGLLILLYIHVAPGTDSELEFAFDKKFNALAYGLRDQNRLLDIASMVAALAILPLGLSTGARYRWETAGPVLAALTLFLILPDGIGGTSFVDMRIVPVVMILALALLDWSRARPAVARAVLLSGIALFVVRLATTATGYVYYDRAYRHELAALPSIGPGSRVVALSRRTCRAAVWRFDRLDHLAGFAAVRRGAWTNSLWEVDDIHLVKIRFRPSEDFAGDPSQFVWPQSCVDADPDDRRTIEQALPLVPYDKIDYLWMIATDMPPGLADPRLHVVWHSDHSTLYHIGQPGRPPLTAPRAPARD